MWILFQMILGFSLGQFSIAVGHWYYEYKTKHAGRRIQLTYMVVEAPGFEVIK